MQASTSSLGLFNTAVTALTDSDELCYSLTYSGVTADIK